MRIGDLVGIQAAACTSSPRSGEGPGDGLIGVNRWARHRKRRDGSAVPAGLAVGS